MIIKAKKQLKSFEDEISELTDSNSHLSIEAKKQFDVGAKELKKLYTEAHEKYDELSHKAEENYKDIKGFIELTDKALRHSFNYFMSHYRKK